MTLPHRKSSRDRGGRAVPFRMVVTGVISGSVVSVSNTVIGVANATGANGEGAHLKVST